MTHDQKPIKHLLNRIKHRTIKSVNKMADFETLTFCIALNSS